MGRPRRWGDRSILNAILYILCEGIRWNSLPQGFPPCTTAYDRFRLWVKDGTLKRVFQTLRRKIPMGRLFYLDATQVPAKKGARRGKKREGKRNQNEPAL
jgi:transposase